MADGKTILIPPICEPLSMVECKLQLRVTNSAEDARIRKALRSARIHCENILRRQIVMQTAIATFDQTPQYNGYPWGSPRVLPNPRVDDAAIMLENGPVQSVISFQYLDSVGDLQTLDASKYVVDASNEPGRIVPAYGTDWPGVLAQINTVRITYAAGMMIPFTADATANTLTLATGANPPVNGTGVMVRAGDQGATAGALPGGLATDVVYYVISASGLTMQLASTPGGSAIDLSTAGTGIGLADFSGRCDSILQALLMALTYFYENRGDGMSKVEMPQTISDILTAEKVWKFG